MDAVIIMQERTMTASAERRDEWTANALALAVEVLIRLCPQGDLEENAAILKGLLDERVPDPKTLANLQWMARDAIDLVCGKEEV
jgi:hypothetical protein